MEFAPSLFSTRVSAGRRTYFIDIKSAKNNKPFLKITQSEVNGDERKKNTLMVFENEIADFRSAIDEAVGFVNGKTK